MTKNLFCYNPEKNNDKVFGLHLLEEGETSSVLSHYGRRGGKLTVHVWCDGVNPHQARVQFESLLAQKTRKGYKEIVEDVATLGSKFPTFAA